MHILTQFIKRYFYKYTINILELVIKQKKEWVVISGKIDGVFENNSMYFFQYLINDVDFHPWWITNNRKIYRELSLRYPNNIAFTYSIKGVLIFIKSRYAVCNYSAKNFNPLYISKGKVCINLWHGIPLKRIGYEDPSMQGKKLKKFQEDINVTDYFATSSDFEAELFKKCFKKEKESILVTGTPRNDFLINKSIDNSIPNKSFLENNRLILYAPTFREGKKTDLLPFTNTNLDKLNSFLEDNNTYLLIRKHPNEAQRFEDLYSAGTIRSRILFAGQDNYPDTQVLLKFTDILITDYSSIYFDFLLLNKPIIFIPYDYDEYIIERNFLYDYYENTPGPKLFSQSEIINYLTKCFENIETDVELRNKCIKKFHKYTDGKSSERILAKMKELNN